MEIHLSDHQWNMKLALEEAYKAYSLGEVPVGAILVNEEGTLLSKEHNLKERENDPCGHAEILAIRKAASKLKDWRLLKTTLYVTLEPCPMCLFALLQARVGKVVFGAYDPKGGSLSLNYNFYKDSRFNHRFDIIGGVLHFDCSRVLSAFFKERRNLYKRAD